MRIIIKVLLLAGVTSMGGCLPTYFPALLYRRSAPVVTPIRSNQDIHQRIGISFSHTNFLSNHTEANIGASLGYSLSKYWAWLGLDVQSEIISGSYEIVDIQGFEGWKYYGGFYSSLFSGLRLGNDRIVFALGPQGAFMYEIGQYSDFRRDAKNAGLIDANLKDYAFNLLGVVIFQFNTKHQNQIFFQGKGGVYEFASFISGVTFHRNTVWVSIMPPIDWPGLTFRFGYSRDLFFKNKSQTPQE